ncbi:cupin domain-containing protein [Actinopolymorpha alba]|uniref:cupin domain-containing protein n=1 Tax=Actinopolymorpha alba TaxID=533267 RepID=UPI00036893E0|nr:cupin domain-containing protein [Actinopolymorpha alba]
MAGTEVKRFDKPDETRPFEGKGRAEVVTVGGRVVSRTEFEPGWRWSINVKPIARTESCQTSHLGYCLSGRLQFIMDDGSEQTIAPGDVVAVEPGHDAMVLGDEPCVFLDFGSVEDFAKPA